MNRQLVLSFFALALPLSVVADEAHHRYIGADFKWNRVQLTKASGSDLIKRNYPQGNLFAGMKLNKWVAFEGGYETTSKKTKTTAVSNGASFLGDINPIGAPPFLVNAATMKLSGFHASMVGLYPLSEHYAIDLMGSLGLGYSKMSSTIQFSDPPLPEITTRNFSKRKMIPRVTLGVQQMVSKHLGLRAMLAWEKTSSFKNLAPTNADSALRMSLKDSHSLGLGVFYTF